MKGKFAGTRVFAGRQITSLAALLAIALAVVAWHPISSSLTRPSRIGAGATTVADARSASNTKLPMVFEPNRGQTDPQVQFVARSAGYVAFLTGPSQAVLKVRNDKDQNNVVTMNLAGANANAKGGGIEKTAGVSNYYIGSDRSKWLEKVPNYAKVRYNDVYPGVDVVYQGDDSRFRYDFVVKPGANPDSIRMQFEGASNMRTASNGSLVMAVGESDFYASSKPFVYQEIGGKKHAVEGLYALNGNEARFQLGPYDKTRELVIDPYFTTATYLGPPIGSLGSSHINAITSGTNPTVTGSGSVYVTGYTMSLVFPTASAYQGAYAGVGNDGDAFVAKLPYNMQSLTFSTYFGGSDIDSGTAIALDSSSQASTYPEAVVVGYTQSGTSFPMLNPVEAGSPTPAQHAFVAKFATAGTLVTTSVLFGNGSEKGMGVAEDVAGNVHVTGTTYSTNLFTGVLAPANLGFQTVNASTTSSSNAFYVKLAPASSSYTVAVGTYVGGFGTDVGNAIAVDPTSSMANVVIVGTSTSFGNASGDYPWGSSCKTVSSGAPLTASGTHAVATEIATATGKCVNSWYIGTNAHAEAGLAAAFDGSGNLYAGGATSNEGSFTTPAVTLLGTPSTGTAQDGWVIEIPSTGSVKGTLVTGDETVGNLGVANDVSLVTGLAVDSLNQIYISGASSASTGASAGHGVIIRRRAFAGFYQPGGAGTTPFLADFPAQESSGAYQEVLALGDIPLGPAANSSNIGTVPAPNATVSNGAANGVSFDGAGNNACFAGFVSQLITMPGTLTVNSLLPTTAYQYNTGATTHSTIVTAAGNGYDTGIVGCATFNSDSLVQTGGVTTNNPSFAFTMPVGTTAAAPATQSFSLVNFDPNYTNPTYTVTASMGSGALTPGTIPFSAANYSPNTTSQGGLWLHWAKAGGDQINLSVVTAAADTFEPGVYTVTFWIVPNQGDNAGVPQKITVTLTITGQLVANTSFGGGVPMSQTVPNNQCTAPVGGNSGNCTFTIANGPGGTEFTDGNITETVQIPYLSLVPANAPTSGAVRFGQSAIGTDARLGTFIAPSWTTPGPAGGAACGGPPGIAPPDHLTSNTPVVCYVTVSIPSSAFATALNGTYANTFGVNTTGLNNPDQGAPESSATNAPVLPANITFTVNVLNNALLFTGNNQFSSPIGAVGNTTITTTDILDTIHLNTTSATTYTATGTAAVGYACPGGAAMAGIPNFAFGNNGTLPASNATTPDPPYTPTQIPYPVSVPNPGSDAQGTYATTVKISAATGQTASMTYCLTVGNVINVSFTTNDDPLGQPPLYIAAGAVQSATMDVTAVGTLIPQAAPPAPVVVPFTIAAAGANPAWEKLADCTGTLSTPTACTINVTPPLATAAMEYDPTWTITATGTAADAKNGADQAVVAPPLPPPPAATTSAAFVFRTELTSGLDLFYWTDFSLYSNSAMAPAGNFVTGATLAGEKGAPFLVDPILTIRYPGGGSNPDWPGTGTPIVLQFYTVQNSGVFTMQDGTPAGIGPVHNTCDLSGRPCQSVYITASDDEPRLTLLPFSHSPIYSFPSVDFLHDAAPDIDCGGFGGFGPPDACTLTSEIDTDVANLLGPGQYYATYTLSTTDGLSANIPQPSPTTVTVILTVTPNPVVMAAPNALAFSFTAGSPATVPANIALALQASSPSAPIAFTLTPTAGSATVALSVNGGAASTAPVTGCVVGPSLQDCKGNAITVTASIINLSALTAGSDTAAIAVQIPAVNPVTGAINAPVDDAFFTIPVTVTVNAVQPFFQTEAALSGGVYYMNFANGDLFGYYTFLSGSPGSPSSIIYHYDMGYEYVLPGATGSAYMYDFMSGHWWYTSNGLFPYMYDFTLNAWIYYVPNASLAGHYTTAPRKFVNLSTGLTITM